MRRIVFNVAEKLGIAPDNRLLDIGCGPGNLLIPLSFMVSESVGIDHPDVIAKNKIRFSSGNLRWVDGPFKYSAEHGSFDCILMYSVLQFLPNLEDAREFLDSAVRMLKPGGRCLVGDLSNSDKKKRFQNSPAGIAFEREWQEIVSANPGDRTQISDAFKDIGSIGNFSDGDIVEFATRYRRQGYQTYILPQPIDLPFGRTREDMLIVRP